MVAICQPVSLPERDWRLLLFLFGWSPLPVPTATLARALFFTRRCTAKTAVNKALVRLARLRSLGLVKSTTAPTVVGRSPAYWYVTANGLDAMVFAGCLSQQERAAFQRSHKSQARLLRRRHDLMVARLEAEMMWFGAVHDPVEVLSQCHDEGCWDEVLLPGAPAPLSVAPDLASVLELKGHRLALLAEVQGTAPPLRAVADKCQAFAAFFKSGQAEERYGTKLFRLLFVTFSDAQDGGVDHMHNVLETIALTPALDQVAYVTTMARVEKAGLTSSVWLRPADVRTLYATLSPTTRARLGGARHKSNRVRAERSRLITERVEHRRLFA